MIPTRKDIKLKSIEKIEHSLREIEVIEKKMQAKEQVAKREEELVQLKEFLLEELNYCKN